MTYSLAKKLKEAGYKFIPIDPNREIYTGKKQIYEGFAFDGKEFYSPTLSELIDACGEKLYSITRSNGGMWCAEARDMKTDQILWCADYQTIEEAVANLWLALKEQKMVK